LRYRALIVLSVLSVLVVSAVGSGAGADDRQTSLAAEMDHASREYGVLRDLLLAMGYVNTRWEMPPPSASDYEEGDARRPRTLTGYSAGGPRPATTTPTRGSG
jgi:hypothetical protein